jgi:hypothetical protein
VDTLQVARLRVRYQLPRNRPDEQRRLDTILARIVDQGLEAALERGATPNAGQVCLRSLRVPVRLPMHATDGALTAAWSLAVTTAVARAVEQGGEGVAHFESTGQALVDMATGVALGDLGRRWAWRQLGLWRGPDDDARSGDELLTSLLTHPGLIVPVLAAVARAGVVAPLGAVLGSGRWLALARAAAVAAGAHRLPAWSTENSAAAPAAARAASDRLLAGSSIAGALLRSGSGLLTTAAGRAAVATLALLEADPAAATTTRGQELVGLLRAALAARGGELRDLRALAPTAERRRRRGQDTPNRPVTSDASAADPALDGHSVREAARAPDIDPPPTVDPPPDVTHAPDVDRAPPVDPPPAGEPVQGGDRPARPLPEVRRRAVTANGGLLFLLHLVGELDLPSKVAEDGALGSRPLRWVLHRLATTLVTTAANDPAALAFAGLGPDADPPDLGQPGPSDPELEAVTRLREVTVRAFAELVDPAGVAAPGLLERVCRRQAEVVADPGWIDVRMDQAEVATEIRRVGLDLDPGYLPWLGVVVRFVYA